MTRLENATRTAAILFAASAIASSAAMAQSLSGSLTVDNKFWAYLSTSPNGTGTPIANGTNWQTTYSFSNVALTPGQNYWLQVHGNDYGYISGFIGTFSLSGTGFKFSNGQQTLNTNTSDWQTYTTGFGTGTIGTGSNGVNGVGPWGTRSGIDPQAEWVWSNDYNAALGNQSGCVNCDRFFQTEITNLSTVPEPSTYALMAAGLAGLFSVARRRRQVR